MAYMTKHRLLHFVHVSPPPTQVQFLSLAKAATNTNKTGLFSVRDAVNIF